MSDPSEARELVDALLANADVPLVEDGEPDPSPADLGAAAGWRFVSREHGIEADVYVLEDAQAEYFEQSHPSPFMLHVYKIRPEHREECQAVNHVDDTGRLQTVRRDENPLYYDLISRFRDRTGTPMVLNTSFNENEPIVCRPEEAVNCFVRTRMDVLCLGPFVVLK